MNLTKWEFNCGQLLAKVNAFLGKSSKTNEESDPLTVHSKLDKVFGVIVIRINNKEFFLHN